jgi:hypothetical protein
MVFTKIIIFGYVEKIHLFINAHAFGYRDFLVGSKYV